MPSAVPTTVTAPEGTCIHYTALCTQYLRYTLYTFQAPAAISPHPNRSAHPFLEFSSSIYTALDNILHTLILPIFNSGVGINQPLLLTDLGRKQSKQSVLAKLVMSCLLGQDPPQQSPTSSSSAHGHDQHLAVLPSSGHNGLHIPHVQHPTSAMATALRALNDFTDTPSNPRSVSSTATNSPRM